MGIIQRYLILLLSILLLGLDPSFGATNLCVRFPSGTPVNCIDSSSGGGITIGTTTITGGANKQVLFNDGGTVGSDSGFTYNKTSDVATLVSGVVSPLITGGTTTTSDLFLQTTSGVGASGADMHFLVGNNGATEAITILNNANTGFGTTAPAAKVNILSTTEQLRLSYDSTHVSSFTVGSTGALTLVPQSGTNFNLNLAGAGDFVVNTNQIYLNTNLGNTGFGIASPTTARVSIFDGGSLAASMLDIQTDDDGPWGFRVLNRTYSTNLANAFVMIQYNDGVTAFQNRGSVGFVVGTGKLGIGNNATAPTFTLDISASSAAAIANSAVIRLQDTGGNTNSRDWVIANGWTDFGYLDFSAGPSSGAQPVGNGIKLRIDNTGRVGVGVTPTAVMHLKAGTATASTAPLKLTSGTLNTSAEAGAIEFLTDTFYGTTTTGPTRKAFSFAESSVGASFTTGSIIFSGATGSLQQDNANFFWDDTNNRIGIGTNSPTNKLQVNASNSSISTGILQAGATTGYNFIQVTNTNGWGVIGVSDSTGASGATNGLAYATLVGSMNSTALQLITGDDVKVTIDISGNTGIGITSPTAVLNLKAGTSTANTAPIKFTSGPLLSIAEPGTLEFLTDSYYVTTTTGTKRRMLVAGTTGRATGQTAAAASVVTYTLGASDATFEVSANVLVTTATLHSFTVTVTYTDEGNTSRTLTLPFSVLAGTLATSITNAAGTVPYEGVPLHIRCKASTAITIQSDPGGTYTTCVYNIEGVIKQIG